jgi:cleavage and polyadenylation specificity factor subunit 1
LLDNGLLIAYEAVFDFASFRRQTSGLHVRFVKTLAHRLGPALPDVSTRRLCPFADLRGMAGAFITGTSPVWLLAPDRGPLRAFDNQVKDVLSFCPVPGSSASYLVLTTSGLHRLELPDLHYDRPVPWLGVVDGKPYSYIVYDPPSETFACASNYPAPFCLFDDEGMPLWEADAADLLGPETMRSSLELVVPGGFDVVDGCVAGDVK